jgi:hypothetical protein
MTADTTRCGGFVAEAHHTLCDRRFDCARFHDRDMARPFKVSACEGGDAFVHVATVRQDDGADHPAEQSPERVLDASSVRTTCAAGGV